MAEKWIIPCNVKVYNVIEHFKTRKDIIWRNAFTIRKGDIAYLYLGSPYGEIKYKCNVVSDEIDDDTLQANSYAIPAKKNNNFFSKKEKYIRLELIMEYPDKTFPLKELKENGLGQVQIQARTDRRLQGYIESIENKIKEHGGDE